MHPVLSSWSYDPCGVAKASPQSNVFHVVQKPGDGIGFELMQAAGAVLAAVEARYSFGYETVPGGAHYFGRPRPLPGRACRQTSASRPSK